ncbi:hypothetical protein BJV78DRAFT_1284921 [Lactifluus subvellereus]|nr:hypothetical protein BJV78DRAFT_1284921 [Lactifluus subvellereus]
MPTTVVGVPTNTDPYAWTSQRVSAQSGLSPTIAQQTPQVLCPAPLGLPGRFSERDTFYPLNMQNTLLSTYAPGDQSTQTTNPPFPVQSSIQPATSKAHTLSAGSMDMTVGQSSPTQGGSFPLTDTDDYFLSSPSSCSQEDLINTTPSPGSPWAIAPDTPTQGADTQQGISPAYSQPVKMQRRTSKSRGVKQPKDLKATRRLQGQRKSDNENIEALRELFVPKDAEVRWKKDRLGTILHYATEWKEMHARLVRATSPERRVRAKDEWFVRIMHNSFLAMMAFWDQQSTLFRLILAVVLNPGCSIRSTTVRCMTRTKLFGLHD